MKIDLDKALVDRLGVDSWTDLSRITKRCSLVVPRAEEEPE